jgi:hypothetical protein
MTLPATGKAYRVNNPKLAAFLTMPFQLTVLSLEFRHCDGLMGFGLGLVVRGWNGSLVDIWECAKGIEIPIPSGIGLYTRILGPQVPRSRFVIVTRFGDDVA